MVTRRLFIQSGGLAAFAAGAMAPMFFGNAALAAMGSNARKKVLVVVYQRFGMDGLLAVSPYTSESLARLRPHMTLPAPGSGKENALLDLDGQYGLHPALSALAPLYRDGSLAIIHAAGSPHNSRSHADAAQWWESGTPGNKATADGWLNRALAAAPDGEGRLLRAASLTPEQPRILYGAQPVTSITDLDQLALGLRPPAGNSASMSAVERLYAESDNAALRTAGKLSFEAARVLAVAKNTASSAANYPENSTFASGMRNIAQLIKADIGLQVAFAESRSGANAMGSWDTHSKALDAAGKFSFPPVARDFANTVAAFWDDLGRHRDDVVLVTHTDFGRNVVGNDGAGADHGRATAIFALGQNIKGGKIYGELPERFERDALEDQIDLPVTTDYRAVLTELAGTQLDIKPDRDSTLFPGWNGTRMSLTRA
ncbi:DUF1501 domain-containing protein [Niveispirillum sp. SYP-B3756]|uniref:DUF1501 domain-containing protein n=1 Tax=Niveispirillum sp. SYP-B3756 TaxID=2662178 RepID=UPI0012917837|nr:DUF1501 domain-containing protein [Niveispirillum sp. SYP-B3756]MQP66649.1 DUF1501 domain-containing protein [Niveispirillum sp. SYP-B3756]